MKCYFCPNSNDAEASAMNFYCGECATNYDLQNVVTTYVAGEIMYAHIYSHDGLHVRLHFKENLTMIYSLHNQRIVFTTIPGLNLTPSNFKNKIGIYLLFS